MRFHDFLNQPEPADEVFKYCLALVFDKDDGVIEHVERLSPEAKLVYLLWCFDGEVHNGGFDQLFFNSLGNHCLDILAGLKVVGATKSAMLLEKAIEWFPNSTPAQDRAERWQQLDPYRDNQEYEAALNTLDLEFYKYEDNLAELLHQYVKDHADNHIEAQPGS